MPYKFVYERDERHERYSAVEAFEMSVDDDRTVSEMCLAFEQFLRAAGYCFEGAIEIVEPEEQLPLAPFDQEALDAQNEK